MNTSPTTTAGIVKITATVTNEYEESYPRGRVTFVMPAGQYTVDRGRIETSIPSDDGKYVVLSVRLDLPAASSITLNVRPRD